ncbi:IclR family transcriptional regulator [Halalkalibacillus halophilus]|uniref:IclR family transcriptional regulator n=1 Tax=Halalkalibacillus halophilus TaxID=392827 RepID=UPI000427409B|nr:IclR family transcriptional regulator [Halalkalibacillus halophilus]
MEKNTSIDKALSILDCFSERKYQLTLDEIVKETSIPKSSSFRIITSLENFGYIKKHKINNKTWYSLGYSFLEKGSIIRSNIDVREYAREYMKVLRNQLNLNVQLAVLDNQEAIYIEQFQSWRQIRLYPAIGRRAPLYTAACPRVLLAYMNSTDRDWILQNTEFKSFTNSTPLNIQVVNKKLNQIKTQGYSISKGELIEETIAYAVPIYWPNSTEVIASLSVVGLEKDFDQSESHLIKLLKETSKEITDNLKNN